MDDLVRQVRDLLHEAADLHHRVYRITDGADEDWAWWYADWLVGLSELPTLLPRSPARTELACQLAGLEREFADLEPAEPWEQFYAERLARHFS